MRTPVDREDDFTRKVPEVLLGVVDETEEGEEVTTHALSLVLALTLSEANASLEHSAQSQAYQFAHSIQPGFPHPIIVSLEPVSEMPEPDIIAYTTRLDIPATSHSTSSSNPFLRSLSSCVLHFTPSTIIDEYAIAHETCHCVLDWRYLGPNGYPMTMSKEDVERFEIRADRCTKGVIAKIESERAVGGRLLW